MATNNVRANCRVSNPILHPGEQVIVFNGLAWSESMGMIHQVTSNPSNKDWKEWLGTQP